MRVHSLFFVLICGCASQTASTRPDDEAQPVAAATRPDSTPADVSQKATPAPPTPTEAAAVEPAAPADAHPAAATADEAVPAEDEDDEGDEEGGPVAEEAESRESTAAGDEVLYTKDLSDEALAEAWKNDPQMLGSISFGFADEGRLMNARQFPTGDGWMVVSPHQAWGTSETIEYVLAAIRQVRAQYPDAPPLRVNAISAPEGGYLRPHKSHQNGRDVDLGFYYPTAEPVRVREREKHIDVPKTWALLKALVTQTDVQMVLLDRRVQKVLYEHALKSGEDKAWLDSVFRAGKSSIVQHARRHRDHFHVRFYNPRAQELGRRLAPLLALRPEQNIAMYRVRKGDTLGAIALRFGSTVERIRKANGIRGSFLRIAQVLKVPLRKPCTRCPVPPPLRVPERKLPPPIAEEQAMPPPQAVQVPSVAGAGP